MYCFVSHVCVAYVDLGLGRQGNDDGTDTGVGEHVVEAVFTPVGLTLGRKPDGDMMDGGLMGWSLGIILFDGGEQLRDAGFAPAPYSDEWPLLGV